MAKPRNGERKAGARTPKAVPITDKCRDGKKISNNTAPRQQGSTKDQVYNVEKNCEQEYFPFEKLPQEIRTMVYRYLLREDMVDRILVRRKKRDRAALHQPWRKQYQFTLGILSVSHETYDGAIGVLYKENQWVLYSETRNVLRQNLTDICFPMIQLRTPREVNHFNSMFTIGLKVQMEYDFIGGRNVSWFVVSRAHVAQVSQLVLTDAKLLRAHHRFTFHVVDENKSKISYLCLTLCMSKRQDPQQWIFYGRACLLRGELNIEEYGRPGREGAAQRYKAAMDAFECGWRDLQSAISKCENGGLACEFGDKKELIDLQIRFAHATSKHCAYASDRDARSIQVIRAFLCRFLNMPPKGTEVDDILRVLSNLANSGLELKDHHLALYASNKARPLLEQNLAQKRLRGTVPVQRSADP
ncbi:MAG: hypothetical protein Q9213_000530 [Squamulea squamosa]